MWGMDIGKLEKGGSYRFANVLFRQYEGLKCLTESAKVQPVDPIDLVSDAETCKK